MLIRECGGAQSTWASRIFVCDSKHLIVIADGLKPLKTTN
jgi:hypothetical protein